MPAQQPWERALERYADSLYRLALLRDPNPARASRATAAAFEQIDWASATLDDQFEARLVAALPALTRRIGDRLRRARRWPLPLPLAFWRLPPAARLALGMRLDRGSTTASIALALNQPLDDVRLLLSDALAQLAGDDPATIDPVCRHSRALRLDQPGKERMHLLGCDACLGAVPRWEAAEQSLANTLGRGAGMTSLPREAIEGIALRLRAAITPTSTPPHNPLLLRTASIVLAVLVVLGLLIVPRNHNQTAAPPSVTARTVIQQALELYGAPPAGSGVLHQRITLVLDEPHTRYEAEVWTDTAQPARHRMQLVTGNTVQEWQSGDGFQAWRYFTQPGERYCGISTSVLASPIGRINRWTIPGDEQATLRSARWQSGPWTSGRLLMEQALAAPTVRSLGTVTEGQHTILTLAAEGGIIDGTMLLRLDAATADLREIRQVTANHGQTRSETRWKLVSQERISSDAATRAGVFTTYPAKQPPRELNRVGTILDPACPLGGQENTVSIFKVLGSGWPQIVGFRTLPADLDRAYLAASHQVASNSPFTYNHDSLALVYLGAGKRLVLRPRPLLQINDTGARLPGDGTIAGEWRVQLNTLDMGRFTGTASHLEKPSTTGIVLLQWDFVSEGFSYQQLLTLLGNVHMLRLQDWLNQQTAYFDPEPLDPAVIELVRPSIQALGPVPGRIDHFVIERVVRQEANIAGLGLDDPYHQLPPDGRSETWVGYGADGRWQTYRNETWQPNGQRIGIEWGDSDKRLIRFYDVRANVLRENLSAGSAIWGLQEVLRPLIQYDGFKVTARDDTTTTIAATLPIAATEYEWALQVQQPPLGYWANRPSSASTIPQFVTFNIKFDSGSGLVHELAVTIPGPNGPIALQRTTFVEAEIGAKPPLAGWRYEPSAGTARIPSNETFNTLVINQERTATTSIRDVLSMSPVQLWGWPTGSPLHFSDAYIPSVMRSSPGSFETIESAVSSGFAVELHYYIERNDPINLLQGPADLLRLLLQQTPPAWTTSEQRILPIAGRRRPVWIMSAERRHWAIVQLDQTLIVLDYRGDTFEEIVVPVLAHLEPIE